MHFIQFINTDNFKTEITRKEKEIESLKEYKSYYNNIILEINKYEIDTIDELFNFLNKYYNHICINNENNIVPEMNNFKSEDDNISDIPDLIYDENFF